MLTAFLTRLRAGETDFEDTIALINALYEYRPTRFSNGLTDTLVSEAGQNEGSCRIFAFGQLNGLSAEDTLRCFGRHYRDVLADPDGSSHGNIRRFMRDGWAGIAFDGPVLSPKA
ncbi:HopJ type III effector protein [Fluviicoccus keumensis]|uniref:HopJ type III effector protein n=1 Tax=Fluviicoccus keumensis TaxID=1435465 RepID=A0A4Q7YNP1_9GAMM|nr:HopJ type III effector protein [Fluviicoccus keumensis]RZU38299.1 HopJ type III effector protein [Fluviicoccus keumensis]